MRARLLLTTDAVGGVWTYSLDLARALSEAEDMVVLLAVLGPAPTPEQLDQATAIPGLQLITTGLPLDWLAADEQQVRDSAWALAELAAEADADLVQLHTPALAVCPYPVPVVSVVHSCVATWWRAVRSGKLPADLGWRAAMVRQGLEQSDLAVAPTRAFAKALQDTYDLSAAPHCVHNGRKASELAPASLGSFVLSAGRLWDQGKNIASFDQAAALSPLRFLAAGPLEGPGGERITLAHATPLGSLSAEALARRLAGRPIFVSAALYEPFGLAVLEAAQAGCALVLADCPGFRELWDGAARFVDPLDAQALAAEVDRLAADADLRARLGAAAAKRAARYTPEAMGQAMLRLFATLAPASLKAAA
jgi:glycosyltransferase involved in cell wall biosynthesis